MSNDLPAIIDAEPIHVPEPERGDLLLSASGFAHGMSVARELAQSQMIPAAFRNKPVDILLALDIARRMGESPFVVLQNIHFVSGKPGWNATFLIARATTSGIFAGPLEFDTTGEGPTLAVTCSGVLRHSGKRVSRTVTMATARSEGWTKNPKYASFPEQMLSYRSAVFLLRLYAPSILLGIRTTDELADIAAADAPPERVVVEPERPTRRTALPIDSPRQIAEAPPEVHSEAVEAEPEAPTRPATWKEGDDDSWEPSRVRFCIDVRELKLGVVDNEVVFDYAEQATALKKRPRQMTTQERAGFLKHLRSEAGRSRLADYVVERTTREAQAEGEPEADTAEGAE
jgi:hypothetical protein